LSTVDPGCVILRSGGEIANIFTRRATRWQIVAVLFYPLLMLLLLMKIGDDDVQKVNGSCDDHDQLLLSPA